jgi:hypothetical protein
MIFSEMSQVDLQFVNDKPTRITLPNNPQNLVTLPTGNNPLQLFLQHHTVTYEIAGLYEIGPLQL